MRYFVCRLTEINAPVRRADKILLHVSHTMEVVMRRRRVLAGLFGAFALFGMLVTDVAAQRRDRDDARRQDRDDVGQRDRDDARRRDRGWVLLGQKEVGFRVDRDVINIGQSEDWYRDRSFKSLQFVAEDNEVHLMSVRLVYFNGFAEDLRVDRLIRRGDDLALDLRGERSYLRRIEMTYRSRPSFRGQAVIKVYGEPARRGPVGLVTGRGDWVELGCQQVSLFGKDRDSIEVGRREGRFKAIRLLVRGADVEVLDLKVVYAGGQTDDISVRNLIRAGERTRPLDLRGWERAIERVEMVYRTDLNPVDIIAKQRVRQATVCVEGLQ
jgi:hypothetical protein